MFSWIKTLFKQPIINKVYQLSKTDPNVIYLDIGYMPKRAADEYIRKTHTQLTSTYPEYKFIIIPERKV